LSLDYVRAPSLGWEVKRDPQGVRWGLPGDWGHFFMLWRGACELVNEACDRVRVPIYCRARASVNGWTPFESQGNSRE